jgi:hypothetical protein
MDVDYHTTINIVKDELIGFCIDILFVQYAKNNNTFKIYSKNNDLIR